MAEIRLSKLDRAEFILKSAAERFLKMADIIGPAGSLSLVLKDTQYNDQAVGIAVLVDELTTDINELASEIKKENI